MAVESVFEFRFSGDKAQEGFDVARSIGADMPATGGYLGHEVVRDLEDDGHVLVVTRWGEKAQADAVLSQYVEDEKIAARHGPDGPRPHRVRRGRRRLSAQPPRRPAPGRAS